MGDGVGRGVGDPGFELLEVVGDGGFLFAGPQPADRLDLEREPAAGQVGAEDEEDRRAGQDGQLGPDRQQAWGRPSSRPGQVLGPDQGMSPFK